MLASLALCGAATTAIVMSTAHAQPAPHRPMMLAQADNGPPPRRGFNRQAPSGGANRPAPGDIAARAKDMCQELVARQNGRLAYLETRLDLTPAQRPLFQRWKDATLGVSRSHAGQCNQRVDQRQAARASQNPSSQTQPNVQRPGPAERMAAEESRLKQRLSDIQAERPALEAFYNALSPQQKTELARAGQRDGGGRGMMGPGRGAPLPQQR